MFSGVAGGLIGLAFFFFLIGFSDFNFEERTKLRRIALCFLLLWAFFPLFNLCHYFLSEESFLSLDQILKSHTPSSILLASFGFFSMSFIKKRASKQESLEIFLWGIITALSFLLLYVLIQSFLGFDYRYEGLILPDSELIGDSRYRAYGFYGHPLSLASASLAIFGFFITLFDGKRDLFWLLLGAFLALFVLFLSGSRSSSVIGLLVLGIFFFRWLPFGISFLLILIGVIFLYFLGLVDRALEIWNLKSLMELPRFIFWKVHLQMIYDSPFFGHGYSQLKYGLKDHYYEILGYGDYFRKYSAHNIYLQILAEIGLIGFLCGAVCLLYLKNSLKGLERKAFCFSFILNLIHGLTQNTLFDASVICVYLYLYLAAITLSINHDKEVKKQRIYFLGN